MAPPEAVRQTLEYPPEACERKDGGTALLGHEITVRIPCGKADP
jgi:hypothetical protein